MNIFKVVAEFYQRNLNGDDQRVLEYLMSIGISSQHVLKAFRIGYASGGLTKNLSSAQFDDLKESNLVDKYGRNRFRSSLTIPLYNLEGEVVDILGQNLGKVGTIKSVTPEAKGIAHYEAFNQDDLIVTDYPSIAFKAYQENIRNIVLTTNMMLINNLKAKSITVLSYKGSKESSRVITGREVSYCHVSPNNKTIKKALGNKKSLTRPQLNARNRTGLESTTHSKPEEVLNIIASDLDKLGYVGESENKKLAYLIATSRKLNRPLSSIIVSSSGAGKTGLMKAVAELIPNDEKLFLSRLTPQALFYMPPDALMEKLIIVDERNGSSIADYSIRTMQTSNVLTMAGPKPKGEDSGVKTINVRCAYMESTTSEEINPENSSRCFVLHLDESPSATEAILKSQRILRTQTKSKRATILKKHHEFQASLKSLPVVIPYVEHLSFPCNRVQYRREQEKFLSLIQSSALLHQHNRIITDDVIEASVKDYEIAYSLFLNVFAELEQELSKKAISLLKLLEVNSVVDFTLRDALTLTSWPYITLYRTIQELLKYEYISQSHLKKGGEKKVFSRLNYHESNGAISKLINPTELSKLYPDTIQQVSTNYSLEENGDKVSHSKENQSNHKNTIHKVGVGHV